jgi:hypothetical protein
MVDDVVAQLAQRHPDIAALARDHCVFLTTTSCAVLGDARTATRAWLIPLPPSLEPDHGLGLIAHELAHAYLEHVFTDDPAACERQALAAADAVRAWGFTGKGAAKDEPIGEQAAADFARAGVTVDPTAIPSGDYCDRTLPARRARLRSWAENFNDQVMPAREERRALLVAAGDPKASRSNRRRAAEAFLENAMRAGWLGKRPPTRTNRDRWPRAVEKARQLAREFVTSRPIWMRGECLKDSAGAQVVMPPADLSVGLGDTWARWRWEQLRTTKTRQPKGTGRLRLVSRARRARDRNHLAS